MIFNIRVGIKRVTNIRDGGVLIETDTAEGLEAMKKEIERTGFCTNYSCEPPKLRRPRVIIFGVEDDLSSEDLHDHLIKQNPELELGDIRIVAKLRARYNRAHRIIELNPEAFKMIKYKEKLNIGWKRYRFEETLGIRQCFKCAAMGHLARDCKSSKICRGCSSTEHNDNDCNEGIYCKHCQLANDKFRLNLDVNHRPFDRDCPQYIRAIKNQMKRIDYGL